MVRIKRFHQQKKLLKLKINFFLYINNIKFNNNKKKIFKNVFNKRFYPKLNLRISKWHCKLQSP